MARLGAGVTMMWGASVMMIQNLFLFYFCHSFPVKSSDLQLSKATMAAKRQ